MARRPYSPRVESFKRKDLFAPTGAQHRHHRASGPHASIDGEQSHDPLYLRVDPIFLDVDDFHFVVKGNTRKRMIRIHRDRRWIH